MPGVVDDVVAVQASQTAERVRPGGPGVDHVQHRHTANDERVRDELTVTAPRDGLGAHDRGRPLGGQSEERRETLAELRRVHVVGVAAEARLAPSHVRRIGLDRTPAAERRQPVVSYAGRRERSLERLARELRMSPRRREPPHVGDAADGVSLQQRDQRLQRPRQWPRV